MELSEKAYRKIQIGGLYSAKAHNNLGILFIKQNKYEKARDAFNAAIKFHPKYQTLITTLGN